MNTKPFPPPMSDMKLQRGVGIIEVLVTLVVISVGLLGIAALQLVSLRDSYASTVRTQATAAADFIIDRMRANRPDVVDTGAYAVSLGVVPASTTRAGEDIAQWKALLTSSLTGSPDGSISINGNIVTVTIRWTERETDADNESDGLIGNNTLTFTTSTEI